MGDATGSGVVFARQSCGSQAPRGTRPAPRSALGSHVRSGLPENDFRPVPVEFTGRYLAGCLRERRHRTWGSYGAGVVFGQTIVWVPIIERDPTGPLAALGAT